MKKSLSSTRFNRQIYVLWVITFGFLGASLLSFGRAATNNNLSVFSSAGIVTKGSLFKVDIVADVHSREDMMQAYIDYGDEELVLVDAQYTDGQYPAWGQNDTGELKSGDDFYIASRTRQPPYKTGKYTLVQLTFRAVASGGTAVISIEPSKSVMLSNNKNVLDSVTGVRVEIQPSSNGQTPLPGTSNEATDGSGPVTFTPPASSGNNGTSTETVVLSDTQQAEGQTAANIFAADNAASPSGTEKLSLFKNAKYDAIAFLILAVLALGAAVFLTVKKHRKTKYSGANMPVQQVVKK